ncbi:hypothetical protein AVEN_108728-1 [Araneus ventricosus]|uniref:Uncharacterized protein n=1 Tax=Araneus ventricosus TaxID=182803 RepID=A0A4Y2UWL6_ARAVE|nr:hypothetical protein AVEN_108728-1 [Araneus ventricosus]
MERGLILRNKNDKNLNMAIALVQNVNLPRMQAQKPFSKFEASSFPLVFVPVLLLLLMSLTVLEPLRGCCGVRERMDLWNRRDARLDGSGYCFDQVGVHNGLLDCLARIWAGSNYAWRWREEIINHLN